jgi:hypothetical protein
VQTLRDTSKDLQQFYREIEDARRKVKRLIGKTHSCKDNSKLVIRASDLHYFDKFQTAIADAETVFLRITEADISRSLRTTTFVPTSNDCSTLERKTIHPEYLINKTGCSGRLEDKKSTLTWAEMVDFPLNKMGKTDNEKKNFTFLHLIANAMIDSDGSIITDMTKIMPFDCQMHKHSSIIMTILSFLADMLLFNYPTEYDEVFSIANPWGGQSYHATMEDLPRLALYLPFLHDNPSIKISANIEHSYLPLLGLDPKRIISGSVRAKTLYLPACSKCGELPVIGGQLLSSALQETLKKQKLVRNLLVLVKPTNARLFVHYDDIYSMLSRYARPPRLHIVVFENSRISGASEAMEVFHRARVVVAPYGAGNAKLLFIQPETVLIEGLCHDRNNKVNLSYQTAAKVLGLRYHGIVFGHKQCVDITAEDVEYPLKHYLNLLGYHRQLIT